MPSIDIRVDVSGIPHTHIVVTDANGLPTDYGFGPQQSPGLFGAGEIDVGVNPPYDYSTGPIDITDQQFQDLQDFISDSQANPLYYSVPGEWFPTDSDHTT